MPEVRGRDASKDRSDLEIVAYSPGEGDIFLKHNESPEATSITIRETGGGIGQRRKGSIGMHTASGNVGMLIHSNGNILVQGKLIFKTFGENVVKGQFTENPLSFIPSTIYSQIPQLLFRFPGVGIILNTADKFRDFLSLFGGA